MSVVFLFGFGQLVFRSSIDHATAAVKYYQNIFLPPLAKGSFVSTGGRFFNDLKWSTNVRWTIELDWNVRYLRRLWKYARGKSMDGGGIPYHYRVYTAIRWHLEKSVFRTRSSSLSLSCFNKDVIIRDTRFNETWFHRQGGQHGDDVEWLRAFGALVVYAAVHMYKPWSIAKTDFTRWHQRRE